MNDPIQTEIEMLRGVLAQRDAHAAQLRAEIASIERELDEFQARYDKIITPMKLRLDVLQSAIDDLVRQQRAEETGVYEVDWSGIAPGYVSVEEQYRRAWSKTDVYEAIHADHTPTPPALDADGLKKLYRELARRFHPDLGADQAERNRRTAIMSQINAAYAAGDADALQALAEGDGDPSAPLALLTLRGLRSQAAEIDTQIERLTRTRDEMLYGALMKLKLDDKLARIKGRDLLQEMRDEMGREYDRLLIQLDALRNAR